MNHMRGQRLIAAALVALALCGRSADGLSLGDGGPRSLPPLASSWSAVAAAARAAPRRRPRLCSTSPGVPLPSGGERADAPKLTPAAEARMERLAKARWPLAQKFYKQHSPVRAKVRNGDEVYVLRSGEGEGALEGSSAAGTAAAAAATAATAAATTATDRSSSSSEPSKGPVVAAVRLTYRPAPVDATFLHSMAVSKSLRGRGLGSQLMQSLLAEGALGGTTAFCFAYDHLLGFYGRYGFTAALDEEGAASNVHPMVLDEFKREKARRSNLVLMTRLRDRPPDDDFTDSDAWWLAR